MKKNKLGWDYIYNEEARKLKDIFQIIPKEEERKALPETLYKYYPLNEFSLDALLNHYLYASCPLDLNDPLDCMSSLISYDEAYERKKTERLKEGKEMPSLKQFEDLQAIMLSGDFGIVSLTENQDDLNMLAHYASNHKGFVVRFNSNLLKKETKLVGPFQINYSENWNPFVLANKEQAPLGFLFLTNIKSKKWENENEWRFVGINREMYMPRVFTEQKHIDNRKFEYEQGCIEEVTIGMNFWIDILESEPSDSIWKIAFEVKEGINFHKYQLLKFLVDSKVKVSTFESMVTQDFTLQKRSIKITRLSDLEFQIEKLKYQ